LASIRKTPFGTVPSLPAPGPSKDAFEAAGREAALRHKEAKGVARRWRIRYKLMVGFGLVLGIMVLLLVGTVQGLWSYYLTMNSIRNNSNELRKAQEFKTAVADVARLVEHPEDWARPRADPPPAPGESSIKLQPEPATANLRDQRPETPAQAITKARLALDDYEHQLQESLAHTPDARHGENQQALIEVLRGRLADLDRPAVSKPYADMQPQASDHAMREKEQQRVQDQIKALERDAGDLCDHIHAALHDHIDRSRSHYQITLWISIPTSIVGLFLIVGLVRYFYGWILHPIRDLGHGVSRLAQGDFSRPIEVHSGDEMEDLAAAFNDMTQRLHSVYSDLAHQVNERSRQLVRSERLASVGFLAAGVAHEINNPLASILFCSEALEARLNEMIRHLRPIGRSGEDMEVFAKYLKMIQEESLRCKNITESLLAFSRTSERKREPTDLRALIQSVLDVTQHLQNHRGKHITFEVNTERAPGGEIAAWVNAEEIKSVVLNLVTNALESMQEEGHLVIRLRLVGDQAEMQFADNGCGMTAEVLENIFEPFFTRSRTGKGTGLGLTISHRIIHQHGGEIEASSAGPNQGSTFIVRLPLSPTEGEQAGIGDGPQLRPIADGRRTAA
jgi:signal transduction histidine kinase